ncbi:hypothetical protein [Photobacterium sp. J15]|nr:hypothetical protein [Photobacterium sp. J15]
MPLFAIRARDYQLAQANYNGVGIDNVANWGKRDKKKHRVGAQC